jgi:hypothetical protein
MPRVSVAWVLALGIGASSLRAQSEPAASPPPPSTPSVKLSGYLQARLTYQDLVGMTASINRARLTASGGLFEGLTWRIQGEFRTGSPGTNRASVALTDGFIRYGHADWALQVGQFKTPFTWEYLVSIADLESADRSTVVDSLAPKRDLGAMGEYAFGKAANLSVGVFNGNGTNINTNPDSNLLGVARAVVHPIAHVSVGANVATYFADSTRFGGNLGYQDQRLVVYAEYLAQHRTGVPGPNDWGAYALVGYFVIPEVQLAAKYEWFERPAVSLQEMNRAWTGIVNIYPHGNFRIVVEYISRAIGDPGVRKGSVLTQFQVKY